MKRSITALARRAAAGTALVGLALSGSGSSARAQEPSTPAASCLAALEVLTGLVERNYSGYADKLAAYGREALDAGPRVARARIARGEGSCTAALNEALAPLRDHHVFVTEPGHTLGLSASEPSEAAGPDWGMPRFELLSESAALITAPSFFPQYEGALRRLVEQHGAQITGRRHLIIDVRANGGGSDGTYQVLAELLYSGRVPIAGMEVWATAENIAARERLLPQIPAHEAEHLSHDIQKMRAGLGGFVTLSEDSWIERSGPLPQPTRVAVLVSERCGSSCEQFLLEARESSKVLLFGEPSFGSLDYSNLGEHPLPSGATAWIPTTRSRRLPEHPIDNIGVPPDVPIDPGRFDGAQRAELLRWVSAVLDDPALADSPPRAVQPRPTAVRRAGPPRTAATPRE